MISVLDAGLILLLIVTLYVVCSPRLAERLYHPALFEPYKYPRGSYESEFAKSGRLEDLFFPTQSGKRLHAWYFKADGGSKTILVCHGNSGNISDMDGLIELLLQSGSSVFVFDYQGFGRSDGRPCVRGICSDARAAYHYLVETLKVDPCDLVVYGESLGGAVACELARNEPINALILQSTFSCLTRISFENYAILGIFPEFLYPPPFLNTAALLKTTIKVPVLIIHGEKDADVRITHAHTLLAFAQEPKTLICLPNTEHNVIAQSDQELFVTGVKEFLQRLDGSDVCLALYQCGANT